MSARGFEMLACDWIALQNVHPVSQCAGEPCLIHNPSPHHMRWWRLYWRDDRGIFERICPHGVGHPDPDQETFWKKVGLEVNGVHGCDGCCRTSGAGEMQCPE